MRSATSWADPSVTRDITERKQAQEALDTVGLRTVANSYPPTEIALRTTSPPDPPMGNVDS